MSLNQQSKVPAYLLGRLFAVLEKAQEDAIPGIQTTIKDRFFSAASTSPSGVFPHLLQNGQHHIAKAKREKGRDFQWDVQAILDLLDFENNAFPSHLSTDEQGIFALGYYHQRAYIFTPKAKRAGQETPSTETK